MFRCLRISKPTCLAIVLVIAMVQHGGAWAQSAPPERPGSIILTIDQERIFAETRIGALALAEFEAAAEELALENEAIEKDLIAEELKLTEERETISVEAFTEKANAFDARVRQIREEQDQKARDLAQRRELARRGFFDMIANEVSAIAREQGAALVIDRRDVFLSADSIDITDLAIQRINATSSNP